MIAFQRKLSVLSSTGEFRLISVLKLNLFLKGG